MPDPETDGYNEALAQLVKVVGDARLQPELQELIQVISHVVDACRAGTGSRARTDGQVDEICLALEDSIEALSHQMETSSLRNTSQLDRTQSIHVSAALLPKLLSCIQGFNRGGPGSHHVRVENHHPDISRASNFMPQHGADAEVGHAQSPTGAELTWSNFPPHQKFSGYNQLQGQSGYLQDPRFPTRHQNHQNATHIGYVGWPSSPHNNAQGAGAFPHSSTQIRNSMPPILSGSYQSLAAFNGIAYQMPVQQGTLPGQDTIGAPFYGDSRSPPINNGYDSRNISRFASSNHPARYISRADPSSNDPVAIRELYETFKKYDKPKKFFRLGRVFMILWTEPFGDERMSEASQCTLKGLYGDIVHQKIRRFIVIAEAERHCLAIPILSYGNKGVARQGLNKCDHGIVYVGRTAPEPSPEELPLKGELPMVATAIRVDPDNLTEKLGFKSRIHYSKVHTIEHNVRARSVGMIHKNSMPDFLGQMKLVWSRTATGLGSLGLEPGRTMPEEPNEVDAKQTDD